MPEPISPKRAIIALACALSLAAMLEVSVRLAGWPPTPGTVRVRTDAPAPLAFPLYRNF
ncbi:MAG: hypothetical protein U0Q16_28355 [Bryobacteraceae bacterium]